MKIWDIDLSAMTSAPSQFVFLVAEHAERFDLPLVKGMTFFKDNDFVMFGELNIVVEVFRTKENISSTKYSYRFETSKIHAFSKFSMRLLKAYLSPSASS